MVFSELRVDDFLCEHAVNHQEGGLEKEDGIDVVAFLLIEGLNFIFDCVFDLDGFIVI